MNNKNNNYNDDLSKIVDFYLIKALRSIAKPLCKELNIKVKSISSMDLHDPLYKEHRGYHCNGRIYIRLRGQNTKKYSNISSLVHILIHEIMHIVHGDAHTDHFYNDLNFHHEKIMKKLQKVPSKYI